MSREMCSMLTVSIKIRAATLPGFEKPVNGEILKQMS